ncbi:hypothetical protein EMQ_1490 [Acetobacter aceti NBRC 14818]|uniref:Uncharacterized protein n=2 Tax=Acetobacter aceti TaxID=435 RepID=A0A6S6PNQ8_ACEAC|nr:hypothetical protein AAJCM20276_29250 [Acetobacter aceti]BCK75884.1 hypothetical protein EMQ_1490 [Acetobacter aceti NBRC 14818]GAN58485.1 hypothetical protein Abac_055_007 [Acetobacter aceti NBRC 14818]
MKKQGDHNTFHRTDGLNLLGDGQIKAELISRIAQDIENTRNASAEHDESAIIAPKRWMSDGNAFMS